MSTVVLIFPDTVIDNAAFLMLPLPVLALGTHLEKNGHKTIIIDQRVEDNWKGLLESTLANTDVICVGISSMTGPQITGGIEASKLVKSVSPDIPVVWGGVHPSLMPEQTAANEFVDIVVIGEGEDTIVELVQKLDKKESIESVRGICYKAKGEVVRTSQREFFDIEKLELPDYHLLDMSKYTTPDLFTTSTAGTKIPYMTSRGCSFRCTYCYNLAYNERKFRGMTPEKVVDQIKTITERYNTSDIFLLDDNFFDQLSRVREICKLLVKNKMNITMHNVNIRADYIARSDQEFLDFLYEVGFRKLFIGCESGSDKILKMIKKDTRTDQMIIANRKLRKAKIEPVYAFMAGFPSETLDQVKETLQLMDKLVEENPSAKVVLSLFSPFPGTPMFNTCLENGMTNPKCLEEWIDLEYSKVNYTESNKTKGELKFLENVHHFAHFLNRDIYGGKSGKFKRALAGVYSSIVRFRVKHNFYFFMPELRLRRILKNV